jgi:hypothetical protein
MSRRQWSLPIGLLLALLSLALLAAGCGGGSSSSVSSSSESGAGAEPSAQFRKPNDKHSAAQFVTSFGSEASAEEREAASEVVTKNLAARAAADFKTQCETLNKHGIGEIPGAKNHRDCPEALTKYAEPLAKTKAFRKDTLSGPIAALRVKGERGYALYHGSDKKDYAVPLEKEDGSWKVSSVSTTEL